MVTADSRQSSTDLTGAGLFGHNLFDGWLMLVWKRHQVELLRRRALRTPHTSALVPTPWRTVAWQEDFMSSRHDYQIALTLACVLAVIQAAKLLNTGISETSAVEA